MRRLLLFLDEHRWIYVVAFIILCIIKGYSLNWK